MNNTDLISRSALCEEYEDYLLVCESGGLNTAHEMLEAAREAPAVDAEPVRHGWWKPYYEPMECFVDAYLNTEIRDVQTGWICSECGRYEQHGTAEEMPYCHCGAKMRGADDA